MYLKYLENQLSKPKETGTYIINFCLEIEKFWLDCEQLCDSSTIIQQH